VSAAEWLQFLVSALVINLAPGPDLVFVLSRTLQYGRRFGLAASAGVCAGALVHVAAAAAGASMLLATSELALPVLRGVGAGYLAYLGVRTLLAARHRVDVSTTLPAATPTAVSVFGAGVLVDVLNPKVSLFFLAYLPQFVRPGAGPAGWQLLWLGLTVVAVAWVIEACLVFAASQGRDVLGRPRWKRSIDVASGLTLIGMAGQLAL
jgi:threonine/homoserine/homoserine lactone efflux protein